jgi:hypothetical protein
MRTDVHLHHRPFRTPRRILSQLEKILFRKEEKQILISLNYEEAIAITIAIFGYKEAYNVP